MNVIDAGENNVEQARSRDGRKSYGRPIGSAGTDPILGACL